MKELFVVHLPFRLHLSQFSGPLDLLFYLVQSKDMDLSDISLLEVCEQYFFFLKDLPDLYVNETASYLTLAARLLVMKIRILRGLACDFEVEEEEEELPTQWLRESLLTYEEIGQGVASLRHQFFQRDSWSAHVSSPFSQGVEISGLGPQDPYDLIFQFESLCRRFLNRRQEPFEIESSPFPSLEELRLLFFRKLAFKTYVSLDDFLDDALDSFVYVSFFLFFLDALKEGQLGCVLKDGMVQDLSLKEINL